MQISCAKQDKALVIALKGQMDQIAATEFDKIISELVQQGERMFVVDMQDLEYISSSGLRSLIAANQQLNDVKGQVRLCNIGGLVKNTFQVSGLNSLFAICDSLEKALKND